MGLKDKLFQANILKSLAGRWLFILSNRSTFHLFLFFGFLLWVFILIPWIIYIHSGPPVFYWHQNMTRNVTIYIKPYQITTIMEPVEPCNSALDVLFAVISSPQNIKKRKIIRKTWGSWTHSLNKFPINSDILDSKMKLVFVLGISKDWLSQEVDPDILDEHKNHGDLIIENFVDSYDNLTLKSIFLLKWVNNYCPNTSFVMKVDDDIFVTVPNVLARLSKVPPDKKLLMGGLLCNKIPDHDEWSHWFTPRYMYSREIYPNYVIGAAYVISGNIIQPLYKTALQFDLFHFEDIFITGICAEQLGIKPVDDIGFSYEKRINDPCLFKKSINIS